MSLHITIGTAPCSWGVWWPDGTPSGTPYRTFLDQAEKAGYKALELGPIGYLPEDPELLKEELESRGLSLCGGTACFDFMHMSSFQDAREAIDKLCGRLQLFHVDRMMVMDENQIDRKKKAGLREVYDRTYRLFAELGKYCADTYGITVLMHPERCSLIETKEDLERLIDLGLYICFDNGHYAAANGGYERGDRCSLAFVEEYIERIPYLHFKNADGAIRRGELEGRYQFGDPVFNDLMVPLEDGIIDYCAYRDLLDRLNFSGVGIIEQDCPHSTADEAYQLAKMNLEYLRKIGMIR